MRRIGAFAALAVAVFFLAVPGLVAPEAAAYSATPRYSQDAIAGGGGGRFFTGSPVDGYTCDVCHEGGDAVELVVSGLPRAGYEPGATYELTVQWQTDEMFALVAELMADDGMQAGVLAIPDDSPPASFCASGVPATELIEDQPGRQIAALIPCEASSMVLEWTAPDELDTCNADAVLYVAGVHGDATESPEGDGVSLLRERIRAADGADPCEPAAVGCTLGMPRRDRTLAITMVMLVLGARRRRQRR